ncbi:MAG: DUF4443 domain-containing protein, partial [Candidatus Bathyarchaeota archaeon]
KRKKRSEVKKLLLLWILNQEGPIGRYRLKELMDLSEHEGIVREMLNDLKKENFILAKRLGCSLTEKGKTFFADQMKARNIVSIKAIDSTILTEQPINLGLHLRNQADKIESTMDIRDIAVRGGASGATIIFFKQNRITIPSVHPDFLAKHPKVATIIRNSFNLSDNDVVAIIYAEDKWKAVESAITVANTLFSSKK